MIQVACSDDCSIALFDDGTIQCWGNGASNNLFTDVVQVACGFYHSVALIADGTVQCWSINQWNQCDPEYRTITNVQLPSPHDTTVLLW